MSEIFTEEDWLAKPSKEQVAKEVAYFGRNFENDDFFKAVYFISRGFTQDQIPELMMKAKLEQQKLLGVKCQISEMRSVTDTIESNVETQHSTSESFSESNTGLCKSEKQ